MIRKMLGFSKDFDQDFIETCLTQKEKTTIHAYSNSQYIDYTDVRIYLRNSYTAIRTDKRTWKINELPEDNVAFDVEGFVESYFPGYMIAYTLNAWYDGTKTIRAGAATDCQESLNVYYEGWVNDHIGDILAIEDRPLQRANEDTCKECALIAAAIGLRKPIPKDFLKNNLRLDRTLKCINIEPKRLESRNYNTNFKKIVAKQGKEMHLLVEFIKQNRFEEGEQKRITDIEHHWSYAVANRSGVYFYNSWAVPPILKKEIGIKSQVVLKNAMNDGTSFLVMGIWRLDELR